MVDARHDRLTEPELIALFDRLFPNGLAGADVLAEIAPEGWERSPLLACFHPPVEVVHQEAVQMHENLEHLRGARRGAGQERVPQPPTLGELRSTWEEPPVDVATEVTELVGRCLWDVFSDNNEVIAADGRTADAGSFRGSAAFLDGYATQAASPFDAGDHLRFYLGTMLIGHRADLMPVYRMIFRRLQAVGADWEHHFTELQLVDLRASRGSDQSTKDMVELDQLRRDVAEANEKARQEAALGPVPAIIRAYQDIYGYTPRGWPPA